MTLTPLLVSAHAATQARVHRQQYVLSWRGGGQSEIVGITSLVSRLGLKLQSVRVYLSKGKGSFSVVRTNPLTGETDLLTVTHIPEPTAPAKRRGRPPKGFALDPRLGSEAAAPIKKRGR
jgi:hypothetical protein